MVIVKKPFMIYYYDKIFYLKYKEIAFTWREVFVN